jgi:hypothetical protein
LNFSIGIEAHEHKSVYPGEYQFWQQIASWQKEGDVILYFVIDINSSQSILIESNNSKLLQVINYYMNCWPWGYILDIYLHEISTLWKGECQDVHKA